MKHLLIVLTTFCLHATVFSQSYEIKSLGTNYTEVQINQAFSTVNWCDKSFKTLSREIALDDGAIITIHPALGSCGQEDTFIFSEAVFAIKGSYLIMGQEASNPVKSRYRNSKPE